MKTCHIINLVFIVLLLAGICVAEELAVSSSLKDIQSRCYAIERIVEDKGSLKNNEIALAVDNLEYAWLSEESNLCYMVNHKSIQEIGQEIAKIKTYVANDDVDAFKVSIESIKFYCHSYLHFMGANLHNVL
jgi:hypothetical protein